MATFALAYYPIDSQCGLTSASAFKAMSDPASPQVPSGASNDIKKSTSSKATDAFDECFQTCKIDEAQSKFMQRMCWMSCAYSSYGAPVWP
jgi:hypothetical protein